MLEETANVDSEFPENELLLRQLVFADRILINKIDLVPEGKERDDAVALIKEAIGRVNTSAQIKLTEFSEVDLDDLTADVAQRANVDKLKDKEYISQVHVQQHEIVKQVESHYIEVDVGNGLDNDAMTRLIGTYLWEGESFGVTIMRCKGKYKGIENGETAMFML